MNLIVDNLMPLTAVLSASGKFFYISTSTHHSAKDDVSPQQTEESYPRSYSFGYREQQACSVVIFAE